MCFRPASAAKPDFICSGCGEVIEETFGVYPDACPFCGHEFTKEELAAFEDGPVPGTAAPGAPAAPAAPGAPKAPSAPPAPKPGN